MARVKTDLRDGVGLEAKSGRHSDPHTRPEVKTLLALYARHQLHSWRAGRTIDRGDVDNFQPGWEKLAKGKLRKWVAETVRSRGMGSATQPVAEVDGVDSDEEGSEDEDDSGDLDAASVPPTFGSIRMVDGELVIDTINFEETVYGFLSLLRADRETTAASESDGETETAEYENSD